MSTDASQPSKALTLEVTVDAPDAGNLEDLVIPIQDAISKAVNKEGAKISIKIRKVVGNTEKGVTSTSTPNVILPPAPSAPIQRGFGFGEFKQKEIVTRRHYLYQLLREEQLDEDVVDTSGILRTNMMRGESYHLVEIPKAEKQVLVCDEEGQATFVSDVILPLEAYLEMNKEDLQALPGVNKVVFRDVDFWRFEMRALLTGKGLRKLLALREKKQKQLMFEFDPFPERDATYYSDPAIVTYDLQKIADKVGVKGPAQVSTSNMSGTNFVCKNGEIINAITYLRHAAIALGHARNSAQAGSCLGSVLSQLQKMAGVKFVPIRGREYYSTQSNVKADLERFAAAAKLDGIEKLNTSHIPGLSVVCANGESVKFATYIKNAAMRLGRARRSEIAGGMMSAILGELKEFALKAPEVIESEIVVQEV